MAEAGKPGWWRYLLTILAYSLLSGLLTVPFSLANVLIYLDWKELVKAYQAQDSVRLESLINMASEQFTSNPFGTLLGALLTVASVAVSLIALWYCIRVIHKRKLITLLTSKAVFEWNRVWLACGVYLMILIVITGVSYGLAAWLGEPLPLVAVQQNWVHYVGFLVVLAPLLVAQVTFEEAFFRGYIFQSVYRSVTWLQQKIAPKRTKALISVVIAGIVSTLLFGLAHAFNGPFQAGIYIALGYFASAAFLQYLAWRSQGLELSIGLHLANNIFAFVLIGNKFDGGVTSLLMDTSDATSSNTVISLGIGAIPLLLFYFVFFVILPKLTKPTKNV